MGTQISVSRLRAPLEEALIAAAAAVTGGPPEIRERDFEVALLGAFEAAISPPWSSAVRQHSLTPKGWQGRVGAVDLALKGAADEVLALVEVKWRGSELWNCAWDVAKLALCRSEGLAPVGLLVAGASRRDWESRSHGAELFDARTWELRGFLGRFATEFAFWRTDVQNHPRELPTEWSVVEVTVVAFEHGGEPWELRAVAVEPADADPLRVTYAPVVSERRGRGRQRAPGPPPNALLPDALRISAGSGLGSSFKLRWTGRALELQRSSPEARDEEPVSAEPDAARWRAFWRGLDRLDAWAWEQRYEPAVFSTDGYDWEVSIARGGRRCSSSGYMAFPGTDPWSETSATWDGFLLALSDLLGGVTFHGSA